MLIDPQNVDEVDFLVLLFVLNAEGTFGAPPATPSRIIQELKLFDVDYDKLRLLHDLALFSSPRWSDEIGPETQLAISHLGVAFLVNYASDYLNRIAIRYGEVPENLTASLVPYLGDLRRVPAADRFVNRADNQEAFQTLEESLEQIRLEILRDQNSNELARRRARRNVRSIAWRFCSHFRPDIPNATYAQEDRRRLQRRHCHCRGRRISDSGNQNDTRSVVLIFTIRKCRR